MLSVLPLIQDDGIEVIVAAPDRGELASQLNAMRVRIEAFGCGPTGERLDRAAKTTQLLSILRRTKPDLIHANSLSMSRVVGAMRAEIETPTIGHLRDILNLSKRAIADIASNDRIIAVSRAVKCHFVESGVSESVFEVIHNGVDLERFRPRPKSGSLHRELQIAPESRFVISVGQLGMRKGVDDSIEAFSRIVHDVPDLHMLIVGERHSEKAEAVEYEVRLHEMARRDGVAGRIHFLGRRSDIPAILNEADVLLHLAHQEPLGRVLIEAAASGCCVLTTDVGGSGEIFPPKDFPSALVPDANPSEAAALLLQYLCDDDFRSRTVQQMVTRMSAYFCRQRCASEITRLYRSFWGS